MKKIILIFLILGFLAGIFLITKPKTLFKDQMIATPLPTSTPAPTVSTEAKSIDGKMKFIMRINQQSENMVSYNFFIFNGEEEYSIFTTDGKPDLFVMPENSWSPDDKYVFFTYKDTLPQTVFVFKASGEPFGEGKDYLDVTSLFGEKFPDKKLTEATGWDSRGLLHIRSQNQDKTKGPSFWFDVDSGTFIQLAAR